MKRILLKICMPALNRLLNEFCEEYLAWPWFSRRIALPLAARLGWARTFVATQHLLGVKSDVHEARITDAGRAALKSFWRADVRTITENWEWCNSPYTTDRHIIYISLEWRCAALGWVESFSKDGPWYAHALGERSGPMDSFLGAKSWAESRSLEILVQSLGVHK
jgi:hypothetical protein